MAESKLNGSVDLLADAMRKVFTEEVKVGVQPMHDDMARMEGRREAMSDMEGMQGQTVERKKGPFA